MRRIRMTFGLIVAALALSTTPALAAQFVSSGGETKSKSLGSQFFKLASFQITCEKAMGNSGPATPLESETFFTELKFKKCLTKAHIGVNEIALHTKFLTPFALEYNANGLYTEIGDEGEEEVEGSVLVKGGAIEILIPALTRENEKCIITIPEQRVPVKKVKVPYEEAQFFNVGNELEIRNSLQHIHFEFEGGQCEEFVKTEEELRSGKYEGSTINKIAKGKLQFQP